MTSSSLELDIHRQPDETTCGPTCLHAVYRHLGDSISLDQVIAESGTLGEGGTLGVLLACHALRRGYRARLHSYNLDVFDPTWFPLSREQVMERLEAQMKVKRGSKLRHASEAYLEFLSRGGELCFTDLSPNLLRELLLKGPILTGLSATWLYHESREIAATCKEDDIRGVPSGHFVVLSGVREIDGKVRVADPLHPDPEADVGYRWDVDFDRLVTAILLGVLTYDANLLQIFR